MNTSPKTFYLKSLFLVVSILGVSILFLIKANNGKNPLEQDKAKHQNRLSNEKSPYLLQHADNPVDWYPWGPEAFAKAASEDKPIFLSIGYSTCHWCHVMEHESFEDAQIAAQINAGFVPIKVDREERPDIDHVYMSVATAMTGSGGWPLTVFLTPDKKPFFAGTYFPPQAKWGTPGLPEILASITQAWQNKRADVLASSERVTSYLAEQVVKIQGPALGKAILDKAYNQLAQSYDAQYGGFGNAPKFPTAQNLLFLLRYWKKTKDANALDMVTSTLHRMRNGGMYDQLGGGFHRYSTDRQWQVPHFEKMLYDQALIARAYLEAYQATGNKEYAATAREIFDYCLRDMQSPQGGFYSAEDADSVDPDPAADNPTEKKEGAYYVWSFEEISAILGKEDAAIFNFVFGIKESGNANMDPHGEFIGKNIIYVEHSVDDAAKRMGLAAEKVTEVIARGKAKLLAARGKRPHPHLDDKVLTDWNGLMIASLAFGAKVLKDEKYLQAAQKAADFINIKMTRTDNRLLHRYRDGDAAILGNIDDYTFVINGLLELYQADFQADHLQRALHLADDMVKIFWDDTNGGLYFSGSDAEALIARQKQIYDGAVPSGNSVAAGIFIRLYSLTAEGKWEKFYQRIIEAFARQVDEYPAAYSQLLLAVDYAIGPSLEVVIATLGDNAQAKLMIERLDERFMPNKMVIRADPQAKDYAQLGGLMPFIKSQLPIDQLPTAYICENHMCKLPLNDLGQFEATLSKF